MTIQKNFLDRVWIAVNLFGLQSKRMSYWQTFAKLSTFIVLLPFYVIVLVVIIKVENQLVVTYEVYQSLPYFMVVAFKWIYFKMKAAKIELMIENFIAMLVEVPEEFLVRSHVRAISIGKKFALVMFVPATIVQVMTFVLQDSFIPIFIPSQLIEHEILIRNIYFTFYAVSCYYSICLIGVIDGSLIYLLTQFRGYSEFLVLSFSDISDRSNSEMKRKLKESFIQLSGFYR